MSAKNKAGSQVGTLRPQELSQKQLFFLAAQRFREIVRPNNRLRVGENPRKFIRELRSFSVTLQPLNDNFEPIGEPTWVVSRDLSQNGMGVISQDLIEHNYVRIRLPDDSRSVIGNIRHVTAIGLDCRLFLIGIEFVESEGDELSGSG